MLEAAAANDGYAVPATRGTAPEERSGAIDFHELFAQIYRSRYIIAGIFAAFLALALIYTLLVTRQYDGVALVEVRQEAEKVLGTESDRESASTKMDSDRFFDTQVDIVRSRSVATAVAEALGFFSNDTFLDTMNVSPDEADTAILAPVEAKRELVIETLLDNLSVGYTGDTRILRINFASPDPRMSARIANAYADAYIRSNLRRKSDSSSYALDFLRDQLREAQLRLEQSERAALEYARRTRIVDVSNAAGSNRAASVQPQSLITAQLVQLNESYAAAVAARIQAEQKWRRVSSGSPLSIPEVLQNLAIQRLLEQKALVRAEYEQEMTTRQADHPAVRQLAERMEELDRQIGAVAANIRRSLQSEYDVARSRENQLHAELETLKGGTLTEQNQGIQLSILRREAETSRAQYDALLRRYNQLNAESGVQTNNLAVVDRASVDPEPSWPSIPLNIALAVILGSLFSGLYLLIQSQLFDRVRTGEDVAGRMGQKLLGAVPPSDDVVLDVRDPKSPISEAFNVVRTGLSYAFADGEHHALMVTSVQAAEGKSSTCLALGMAFARLGKRVLVIDIDLRRPNVHRLLNLPNNVGTSAVLAGTAEAHSAIRSSGVEGLDVITAGEIPSNPSDLIMGQRFTALISEMKQAYDLVLVDSAPMLSLADAVILSGRVDAVLFVVEAGRNSVRAVQRAIARINGSGGEVAGVILNKYDPGRMGYGASTDYAYNYSYSRAGADDQG